MKMINKNLILILTLSLAACSLEKPGSLLEKPVQGSEKVIRKADQRSVTLSFNTQATALSRIKSFEAFLSSNFSNPFASGANPFGDNVKVQVNNSGTTTVITFSAIPAGGPYFAVIAGFDNVIGATPRNNITRADATLASTDKKWARSSNTITVSTTGIIFSNGGTELNTDLKLDAFNNVGVTIAPQNGPVNSGAITVSP